MRRDDISHRDEGWRFCKVSLNVNHNQCCSVGHQLKRTAHPRRPLFQREGLNRDNTIVEEHFANRLEHR